MAFTRRVAPAIQVQARAHRSHGTARRETKAARIQTLGRRDRQLRGREIAELEEALRDADAKLAL
ncbi:MAG: hypothetical protein L0212_02795, partial [Acidobacteria bacterium]|nr:hypothetical protein [Acidobacteriota bacterium]